MFSSFYILNNLRNGFRVVNKKPFERLWISSRPHSCGGRQNLTQQVKSKSVINNGLLFGLRQKATQNNGSKKVVGYWLATCGGMVFVAVVLGGVTRLTGSGLSMVTWKLLGERMPRSEVEWQAEFERYKQFPEYKIVNKELTLSDFKWIWYMEYGHRMWGRAIGFIFAAPAAYFWFTGSLSKRLKIRVAAIGLLIGCQGLMGWYMVKSGLEDRFHGESDIPRVSQYRLASHLSLAFILYSLLAWSALDVLLPAQTIVTTNPEVIKAARRLRIFAHSCKGLVFLTAFSGAFVAGLDAGRVYNSFPKMADRWIPDDIFALSPKLVNITENPTTTQFNHRLLGTSTVSLITILWWLSRNRKLPARGHTAANCLAVMAWIQVSLGITTLLTYVPISLATLHQSGSLMLLSIAIWLTHELKRLPK